MQNEISKYRKRSGTSGITGSLYRSHLLSLILSRNLNEETEFVLGCNVNGIGVMNEICLRFLHKDNEGKPAAVFIKSIYTGHITDDDLTNAKSAFNLYKCYQSHILIKEKFDNNPDALFERKDNTKLYFIIYTPHQCKIKNNLTVLKDNDDIFTNNVNSIICTGNNNNIFKVGGDSLVTGLINSTIEHIGKTIATYVTLSVKDRKETTEDMKNVLLKYGTFLIPHVIKINELDENYSGKFNESMHENNTSHIQLLKKVLFTEILMKSVINEEASTNIQLLLEANEYTVDLLSALVGFVITFDENTNKLAYMPQVSDSIKKKPLNEIKVKKSMVEEAFVMAGKNALRCININFSDLDMSKLITKQESEEESENVFEAEKQLADRFLQNLYIYTDQVNKNDIGKRVLEEMYRSQASNKNTTIFKNKPEALLLKFHHKVQEWMLSMDKPQYLTNSCDFLKDNTYISDSHLSVLNYNCIMELRGYSIKFNNKSFNSLSNIVDIQSRTNIISNNVLLTSIKLMQYMSDKSSLFVNVDHVCNIMKEMEFDMLIKEINKATVKTLVVIVCETEKYTTKSKKFREIVVNFPGNVYAISNHDIEDFETIYDTVKGLEDTDNINDILKYEITVQGEKVELGKIIDEKTIHLIDARILTKILTNKNIKIGKSLSNSSYDEIKDYFIDRRLCEQSSSCDTFLNHMSVNSAGEHCVNNTAHIDLDIRAFDFYNEVVAIFAEPGMGKTTLLTHLSVNTKHVYPKTWIVRINLLNFCEDFFKWEEEETDVDIIESMHLVCRAELNHKKIDNLFALEKDSKGDLVVIESKELDPIATLHLKLIIHCFNSGNIIFLFDGFDEICPHYEMTVVQFIKSFAIDIVNRNTECLDSDSLGSEINLNQLMTENAYSIENSEEAEINGKQLVITSRPYNAIKKTLETEFNIKPLYLTQLSISEQYRFYSLYWETQIKLVELNTDQLKNVDAFFEHINKYHLNYDLALGRSRVSRNMLLCRIEEAAVIYFRIMVDLSVANNIDKQRLFNKWALPIEIIHVDDRFKVEDDSEQLQLIGIPLHMKIHADLFVNQIKDTSSTKQWDMGVYNFEFYKRFLEIKLKKIRLEEKGGENVHAAAFLTEYEDLVAEVTEEHKKLAFYAFFHNASSHFKKVLPETQWMKIDLIIERIKEAEEKTGLIDQIHNGVPRFVHVVFAEYFAVEYIADMIKKNPLDADQVHRQIDFVVNCLLNSSVGIMTAFNHKLMNDKELKQALNRQYTRQCIFTVWLQQDNHFDEDKLNKKSCLTKVLENRLIETAWLLLSGIKDMLNSANVENFVESISDVFQFTIIIEDLIVYILDAIRRVDPSMVVKALSNCDLQLGDIPENEIILKNLRDRYPGLTLTPLSTTYLGHPMWCVTQKDETVGAIWTYMQTGFNPTAK